MNSDFGMRFFFQMLAGISCFARVRAAVYFSPNVFRVIFRMPRRGINRMPTTTRLWAPQHAKQMPAQELNN
jgi:hypothetical protein